MQENDFDKRQKYIHSGEIETIGELINRKIKKKKTITAVRKRKEFESSR